MAGILTAKQMLKEGLDLIGISPKKRKRMTKQRLYDKFKAHFGRHPLHVARVWRDPLTTTIPEARVDDNEANLIGFLASLNFVKSYAIEDVRDDFVGDALHLNQMRELSWFFVGKIAALKALKIVWPADNEWQTTFIASVDGTHKSINEPRDPNVRKNRIWYSHKDEHAGLNFEVVLSLYQSRIVHAKLGTPASTSDITEMKAELLHKIPAGKRLIADKMYATKDLERCCSTWNQFDTELMKEFKRRAKTRHESINDRIKTYGAMRQTFRHGPAKAQLCFDAVLAMAQYAIEDTGPFGEPLFDV